MGAIGTVTNREAVVLVRIILITHFFMPELMYGPINKFALDSRSVFCLLQKTSLDVMPLCEPPNSGIGCTGAIRANTHAFLK